MPAPLLETRDLSMHFGGVRAVRNVNFTLAEGELRCLIGPNGAGKSTFFKMLTGQLEPSDGQVLFRGKDIANAHAHDIAQLLVAQVRKVHPLDLGPEGRVQLLDRDGLERRLLDQQGRHRAGRCLWLGSEPRYRGVDGSLKYIL